jgi:hypothetical protein
MFLFMVWSKANFELEFSFSIALKIHGGFDLQFCNNRVGANGEITYRK